MLTVLGADVVPVNSQPTDSGNVDELAAGTATLNLNGQSCQFTALFIHFRIGIGPAHNLIFLTPCVSRKPRRDIVKSIYPCDREIAHTCVRTAPSVPTCVRKGNRSCTISYWVKHRAKPPENAAEVIFKMRPNFSA